MGTIMFYFLFPINALAALRKDLYNKATRVILKDLGWPGKVFDIIHRSLEGKLDYNYLTMSLRHHTVLKRPKYKADIKKGEVEEMIKKFGEFILGNVEDNREDRLFPADPFLYSTNPMSLGFGACGVMYALKKCGFENPPKAYTWFEKKLKDVNEWIYPPGLLTGTSGIAWALSELGYNDKSLKIMEITNKHKLLSKTHSLFYGAAGAGMTNLYLYLRTQLMKYLDVAITLGDKLLNVAKENKRGIYWENEGKVYIGYGYGQSGVALFLLRLYQLTGNRDYLVYGKKALEFDLSYGREIEDGTLSFPPSTDDTSTLDHYLEVGSAGIAKILLRFGIGERVKDIISDVYRKYSVFCGLLFGLSSFVDILTDAYIFSNNNHYLRMAKRPLTGIKQLYLLKLPEGYATPGDSLYRISCDYATGVAGVMRTLHRYITLDKADFTLDGVSEI